MPLFDRLKFKYKEAKLKRRRAKANTELFILNAQFPSGDKRFLDTKFLAIDCEMSGLNPHKEHLLSIGWVVIEQGRIITSSAHHIIFNAKINEVGESVLIHGLHDHMITDGSDLREGLDALCKALEGSIAVFHHAPIDIAFIQKAAKSIYGCPLLFTYIDTMYIEMKKLYRHNQQGSLRLQPCRARYGLPDYAQHNALADAQATAELFLAQADYKDALRELHLRDFTVKCV